MLKKIVLVLIVLTTTLNAQHTIKGTMGALGSYEWIILYQLQGSKQNYIANADITNGSFSFTLPESATPGVYRMVYDLESRLFVDVLYNNEDIVFKFHPKYPKKGIGFKTSKENIVYQNYLKEISSTQEKLDSLQVAYFNSSEKDTIKTLYQQQQTDLTKTQQHFELTSKGKLAYHFIKASATYYPEKPFDNPQDYLNSIKTHFFDFIDFNDETLLNSTFISDKITDYIFYINRSEDAETNIKLQKDAIATVISNIGDNLNLARDVQEGLLYNFTQQQNIPLAKYILENYYQKLPASLQDVAFRKDIELQLKTVVGNKAPNILWTENKLEKDLYSLTKHDYFVVVFWSSSCGHCLKEMPILFNFLKDKPKTKVIAIGLETEESKADWKDISLNFKDFIHIYGANKWKNQFAVEYGVNSTPSFYILDTDKKIIAKPYDVAALKVFFEK